MHRPSPRSRCRTAAIDSGAAPRRKAVRAAFSETPERVTARYQRHLLRRQVSPIEATRVSIEVGLAAARKCGHSPRGEPRVGSDPLPAIAEAAKKELLHDTQRKMKARGRELRRIGGELVAIQKALKSGRRPSCRITGTAVQAARAPRVSSPGRSARRGLTRAGPNNSDSSDPPEPEPPPGGLRHISKALPGALRALALQFPALAVDLGSRTFPPYATARQSD